MKTVHPPQRRSDGTLPLTIKGETMKDASASNIEEKLLAMSRLGRVLINRKQLLQKVPLSERTILNMEKRGTFPRRFAISTRHVAWDLHEIDTWIAQRHNDAIQQIAPGKM